MTSLDLPGRVLPDSFLLSLGWSWMLKWCHFSQVHRAGSAFCVCSLATFKGWFLQLLGTYIKNHSCSGGMCEWSLWSAIGACGPVGGICRWGIPCGSQADILMDSVMQLVALMSLWSSLRALSATFTVAPHHSVTQHTSIFPFNLSNIWVFCSESMSEILCWTPGFPQDSLVLWWLSKLVVLEERQKKILILLWW